MIGTVVELYFTSLIAVCEFLYESIVPSCEPRNDRGALSRREYMYAYVSDSLSKKVSN